MGKGTINDSGNVQYNHDSAPLIPIIKTKQGVRHIELGFELLKAHLSLALTAQNICSQLVANLNLVHPLE